MNSYPVELYSHLYPLMFVGGLEPQAHSDLVLVPAKEIDEATANPFAVLISRLRDYFASQRAPASVWVDSNRKFNVLLVDRDVKFPPRKDISLTPPRSPLSPATSTSPLHPDGLIAPIWLRKHLSLVPSVFVLFLRLAEPSLHSPLETLSPKSFTSADSSLAAEIAARKKQCVERGIKLTVVLITSRRMLDDSSLDARLAAIRRQSSLDARAALFVLSPVSASELVEFINSLLSALVPPALEYYTNHSKRVRRKRTALPTSNVYFASTLGHLPPIGWNIRYEFKQGCFAEFRGEKEVALKHYLQAIFLISEYIGATTVPGSWIVPPRTKRWAEAKLLADCISIKVLAHHLSPPFAPRLTMTHFNTHLAVFSKLSRSWGMSDKGWELWSWKARQYRILADLILSCPTPTIPLQRATSYTPPTNLELDSSKSNDSRQSIEHENAENQGVNPSTQLSHPAFYYWMASECTMVRRQNFLDRHEASNPSYANEKNVDHLGMCIELLVKSYENFKKYKSGMKVESKHDRFSIYIATKLAKIRLTRDEPAIANRLFPIIASAYRAENFIPDLQTTLFDWFSSVRSSDAELGVELLLELMSIAGFRQDALVQDLDLQEVLLDMLKQNAKPLPTVSIGGIVRARVAFYNNEADIRTPVPFQLHLEAPSHLDIAKLRFSELKLFLTLHNQDRTVVAERQILVKHKESNDSQNIRFVNCGIMDIDDGAPVVVEGSLAFRKSGCILLRGAATTLRSGDLSITNLLLQLREEKTTVDLSLKLENAPLLRWLKSDNPATFISSTTPFGSICKVRYAPHILSVSLEHPGTAFVNEEYPIRLTIKNNDTRVLKIMVVILLPPGEEVKGDYLINNGEHSANLIKQASPEVLQPGQEFRKDLFVVCVGVPGDRLLDISVNSSAAIEAADDSDTQETLKTLTVPSCEPLRTSAHAVYRQLMNEASSWFSQDVLQDEIVRDQAADVRLVLQHGGPSIEIMGLQIKSEEKLDWEIKKSSVDPREFPIELSDQDDAYTVMSLVEMSSGTDGYIEQPGHAEVSWRRKRRWEGDDMIPLKTYSMRLPLPELRFPPLGLAAFIQYPAAGKLHAPMCCHMRISNPLTQPTAKVEIRFDANESFVFVGLRQGQLPLLTPGMNVHVTFTIIPMAVGYVAAPDVRVEKRREDREDEPVDSARPDFVPVFDASKALPAIDGSAPVSPRIFVKVHR